ncbi:MAG: DUF2254 domain-containing protein [Phycisphaerae bacterium]|nr:DUF2254 domain-containing protein [Phycisphaerae bacterium]
MKTRLRNMWELVRTSLWFTPALMVSSAIVLSVALVTADEMLDVDPHDVFAFVYNVGPDGAREVLSTIAGSIMTVAGVAFSVTIVALTLASSQFGPHVLRNFMKDKGNQFVLGTFIATFIYCLLVLRTIHTVGDSDFVPAIAVTFAMVLAIVNVGVLIFFVHHISVAIQADTVISSIFHELVEDLHRLFPEELGEEPPENENNAAPQPIPEDWPQADYVNAPRSGYLQAIDSENLMETARKHDLLLYLRYRPGDYIAAGSSLATVRCGEKLDRHLAESMAKSFIVGSQRTPEQDAEFGIHQLVEVAVRALSPSINSPYTAITCVDRLGSVLCFLTRSEFPSSCRYDDDGQLRVIARPMTFSGITNAAFDQIRQYGRTSVAVTVRLLETLRRVAAETRTSEQKHAIGRQADMIARGARESLPEKNDVEDVQQRYQTVLDTLKSHDLAVAVSR